MQKYADYTPAQAAWLDELPSHWQCTKIGALFSERKSKVSDKDYAPLSVARIGVVPQLATAVKTDAGDNRKLVCAGDFVINSRSDRKGSCGVAKLDGSVSLINIVLDFLEVNGYIGSQNKAWVDKIRKIGNKYTHEMGMATQEDADKVIVFIKQLLGNLYEMPHLAEEEEA